MKQTTSSVPSGASRREFLAVAAAGAVALGSAPLVHAGGSDTLRVGLIGCGGRGTGAAGQALHADPNVKLTAMGDLFEDHLQSSLANLRNDSEIGAKVDVKPDHCFIGWDAYKQVLASGVDVVLLTTPPHFRPLHLKAAVEAGKHVFCEKPVAVDAPGVQSVVQSCREAKKKNLAVVSGLCYRYEHAKRETMQQRPRRGGRRHRRPALYLQHRLPLEPPAPEGLDRHGMAAAQLALLHLAVRRSQRRAAHPQPGQDDVGDEGRSRPSSASALGGRQVRTDPSCSATSSTITAVVYEWADGVKLFAYCRQQDGCAKEVTDFVLGTKGTCDVMKHKIIGENAWASKIDPRQDDMYQNEHNELFASIRKGKPINNGDYMTQSTLMAIMGRMATYTGQVITWEMALNSKEDLTPAKYEFGDIADAAGGACRG